MRGWKTWLGSFMVGGSAVLSFLGLPDVAGELLTLGGAFGLIGIGHKIEKGGRK